MSGHRNARSPRRAWTSLANELSCRVPHPRRERARSCVFHWYPRLCSWPARSSCNTALADNTIEIRSIQCSLLRGNFFVLVHTYVPHHWCAQNSRFAGFQRLSGALKTTASAAKILAVEGPTRIDLRIRTQLHVEIVRSHYRTIRDNVNISLKITS